MVSFTQEALTLCTGEQKEAILRLVGEDHSITVMLGGFDLPSGYLSFNLQYAKESGHVYGGISANGDVSM
jgi:hypothetical protein